VTTGSTIFCGWVKASVIDSECWFESRRTVACRAFLAWQQGRMRKRRSGRWDTRRIQSIVAGRTGYRDALAWQLPQHAVAEDTAHVETGGVMAGITGWRTVYVDMRIRCGQHRCYGNAVAFYISVGCAIRMATRVSASPRRHDFWIRVIRERCAKRRRGMTAITLYANARVPCWIRIGAGINSDRTIVAGSTRFCDRRVIVGTIWIAWELDELGGVMAIAAFLGGLLVKH